MNDLFLIIFLLSGLCLIIGLIKPGIVIRWGHPEKRGRKQVLITCIGIAIVSFFAFGMTIDKTKVQTTQKAVPQASTPASKEEPVQPPQSQPTQQQEISTMDTTISEFIDIYNKEVARRYSKNSTLGTGSQIKTGIVMYDVPDGKGSTLVINFNPADSKITKIAFTIQGETGGKFERKELRAWTAAIISATSPGVSNDDIVEIREKLLSNTPIVKNGIDYMSINEEKGSPFFQIIARAK